MKISFESGNADRDRVFRVVRLVSNLMSSDSISEIIETIREEVGVELTVEEVEKCLERFDEVGFIGADELIHLVLRKLGYVVFKSGRANIVVIPTKVQCRRQKTPIDGVEIIVLSDPDSGIISFDSIHLTGYRFGLDSLRHNGMVYYDVHRCYGDEEYETLIRRLSQFVNFVAFVRYSGDTEAEVQQRRKLGEIALILLELFDEVYKNVTNSHKGSVKMLTPEEVRDKFLKELSRVIEGGD